MHSSPHMVRVSYALRSLQILECLCNFRPTLVGSTSIDIALDESDLDIICEAYDLDNFEQQTQLLYGNRSNFSAKRMVAYSLPSSLVSFFSHGLKIGIFGQAKPIEEQAAFIHMKVEERLLEVGGAQARAGVRDLKRNGMKTEPAFASYFKLPGDPYQALLELAPYSVTELAKRFSTPL